AVTFGDAAQTNTTANFSAPGSYTLMVSGDDGVHAVAYDALLATVVPVIVLQIVRMGTNAALSWSGGNPPFVLGRTTNLPAPSISWTTLLTTNGTNAQIPLSESSAFFRVRSQ